MHTAVPLACFLSVIRPFGIQFESALLQVAPVDKSKCPAVRDGSDIQFQLFTRYNPIVYQELVLGDDEKLMASHIDFHDRTVIYFHAWMEMPDDGSGLMVREAYLQRGDTNVIMVDASSLEAGPWYGTAAENTWYIGRFAALFVDYLVSRGLDLSKTHFVGHSLGAQAAGVAGGALTSGRVSRITGLDPAMPLFAKLPLQQRLDPSDAAFVDVIHTDSGIFGVNEPTGHADFYPNGGISPQPGCELEVVIPKQLLLQKCDNRTQPKGYFTYYLQPVKTDHEKKRTRLAHKHRKTEKTSTNSVHHFKTKESTFRDIKTKDSTFHAIKTLHNFPDIKDMSLKSTGKIDFDSTHSNMKTKANIDTALGSESRKTYADSAFSDTERKTASTFHVIKPTTLDLPQTTKEAFHDINLKSIIDLDSTFPDIQHTDSHVKKRQKRFLSFLKRSEATENENFLFKLLEFVNKNRRNVIPVFTVMREINTLIKSANGELNHSTKERNNYIGQNPPITPLTTYNLELGSDSKVKAFVKRLLGLKVEGDRLTITGK